MADPDVLTKVPAALKQLDKYVIRGFYGIEHALALDVLIRNLCVKEEDMLELLKLDQKQLQSLLNNLKGDKFIKCRIRVETAADGKTTHHNYYFINYRTLVNVVKYKLDHMRRRIETDERDSTKRASFKYLEDNQLFGPMTGTFRYVFCHTETEDVNLAYEILEPEPTEIPALKQSKDRAATAAAAAGLAGSMGHQGPSYEYVYTQNVVINMDDQDDLHRASLEGKSAKERTIWLRESTIQGAHSSEEMKEGGLDIDSFQEREEGRAGPDDNEEVTRALLIHEKKTPSATAGSVGAAAPVTTADGTVAAHHGEEDEEKNEFEEGADDPIVMVAGRPFSYSEVSQKPELVAQMTPDEKEAYIAMRQRTFEDLFD
ncbi:hypothetical protein EI555_002764 [Monodon monoceros]|uniref:HTH TFE/IIEalpha-type domain-containing protein n=1 Tax=Monodon monoceros TaxID=40151 RepID=A0A4U1EJR1_MONMO|nr:hypothetical protein EI555_002764 [Monodon monoceros]